MVDEVTATTVVQQLRQALNAPANEAQFEGFCAGDAATKVTGVAVCLSPSVDVLKRAIADKKNLIISREHPFYTHGLWYAEGTEAALKNDPVAAAKRDLITSNGLVVYRLSSAWDTAKPQSQSSALAGALGWRVEPPATGTTFRGIICDIPKTTLAELASQTSKRLKRRIVRGVGNKNGSVSRVAVINGYVEPATFEAATKDPRVDGIIAGEANEWEGGPYIKDLNDSGRAIGVVYVGYMASEEPGVPEMARWIKATLSNVNVTTIPTDEPYWLP